MSPRVRLNIRFVMAIALTLLVSVGTSAALAIPPRRITPMHTPMHTSRMPPIMPSKSAHRTKTDVAENDIPSVVPALIAVGGILVVCIVVSYISIKCAEHTVRQVNRQR